MDVPKRVPFTFLADAPTNGCKQRYRCIGFYPRTSLPYIRRSDGPRRGGVRRSITGVARLVGPRGRAPFSTVLPAAAQTSHGCRAAAGQKNHSPPRRCWRRLHSRRPGDSSPRSSQAKSAPPGSLLRVRGRRRGSHSSVVHRPRPDCSRHQLRSASSRFHLVLQLVGQGVQPGHLLEREQQAAGGKDLDGGVWSSIGPESTRRWLLAHRPAFERGQRRLQFGPGQFQKRAASEK